MPTRTNNLKIPQHIAIIMDGNGRWAKKNGKARIFGHRNGVKSVRSVSEGAAKAGVKYLTLYAFSTENWNRPKTEINALMQLLVTTIGKETKTLNKNNIQLKAIGDLDSLPKNCNRELRNAIEETSKNDGMKLVLALSYSAKWEIIEATRKLLNDVKQHKIDVSAITEELFSNYLCTKGIPDPELLIRTSGEYRISNFLLWQLAYTELYFTEKLWPDFREEDLLVAIEDYNNRERRFGKTTEQLAEQKSDNE